MNDLRQWPSAPLATTICQYLFWPAPISFLDADLDAAAAALEPLGRLAADLGDGVASIDINPFVALPVGHGGLALDALVVLQRKGVGV
jgi:hypothetical protein